MARESPFEKRNDTDDAHDRNQGSSPAFFPSVIASAAEGSVSLHHHRRREGEDMTEHPQETTAVAAVAPAAASDEATNPYVASANDSMTRLRAISEGFPEEPEPRPLKPSEIRLANSTSVEGLEQAALFANAAPNVGGSLGNVEELRDAINFVFANVRVRDEAMALVRRVDHAIIRRKVKAVKVARSLYRVAKAYATTEPGDAVKAHVTQLQRTLGRRRRKPAPQPDPTTVKVEPKPDAK
jgi:hypothetical protein